MSLIVSEVYDALVDAGASPETAKAAAGAVPSAENVATQENFARLEARIDRLEARVATKADFTKLETDFTKLETDFARFETDFARFEAATKADFARLEANMATKADFAKLDKRIAVLQFAVFGFGPIIVALLVKLAFFP